MSTIRKVAIAGASGRLGSHVLQALLDADFSVVALTRPGSKNSFPSSVEVVEVDYGSVEDLTAALKGQDAVVATLGPAGTALQKQLFEAAIAGGVQRLIPSEFGSNVENSKARQLPVYGEKIEIQEFLKEKTKGTQSTYTIVYNNLFLDFDLDLGFITNLRAKKMEIFDGGEHPYTTTPLPFVGKGVAGVLRHPDETANRTVRLNGVSLTQNQFLKIAQRVVGEDGWQIQQTATPELLETSLAAFEKDPANVPAWAYGMVKCAIFGQEYGADFSEQNDNGLLGLKELSESEVEEMIRSRA